MCSDVVNKYIYLYLYIYFSQTHSQLSRLSVKYGLKWSRSPEPCWIVAMLTSCCGRPVWKCSAALAAATPRVYSASRLSHTPDTCRWQTERSTAEKCTHCVWMETWPVFVLICLQVMKIEYMNQKAIYANAVVSVVDHVECRCQPAPPPPRKKSSRRQHGHQNHRNQTHSADRGHAQVVGVETMNNLNQCSVDINFCCQHTFENIKRFDF